MSGPIEISGAGVRLRPPRHRVCRKAIALWALQAAMAVIVALAAVGVGAFWWVAARGWLVPIFMGLAVLGLCYVLAMPTWRYAVHRWETTEQAVYTAAGWISQEWRVAPMSRIQTVDTARGPLQRLLGLSSVTVTTASAAGPLSIDGLDHRVASEVVQQLTETTQATPGDAT